MNIGHIEPEISNAYKFTSKLSIDHLHKSLSNFIKIKSKKLPNPNWK